MTKVMKRWRADLWPKPGKRRCSSDQQAPDDAITECRGGAER